MFSRCFLILVVLVVNLDISAMIPSELYDGLHGGFETEMPTSLVSCSNYAAEGELDKAATELFNFKQKFNGFFFSDFVNESHSAQDVKSRLEAHCSAVVSRYAQDGYYDTTYSVNDFIWYSLCGALYYAYEGMLSQIMHTYDDLSTTCSEDEVKKRIRPVVQDIYQYLNHNRFNTFSDFCKDMLGSMKL